MVVSLLVTTSPLIDTTFVGVSGTLFVLVVTVETASTVVLFAEDRLLSMDVPSIS